MSLVICSSLNIDHTLRQLQEAGRQRAECVVLWLGRRNGNAIEIDRVYRPAQIAKSDVFRILPDAMKALLSYLSQNNLMIGAQVHSHPFEAFHSRADDQWAIVRHLNALSIVVPYFGLRTNSISFRSDAKVFQLTEANQWRELQSYELGRWLKIQ